MLSLVQSLLRLAPGSSARLSRVDGGESFRARVAELGLVPGTLVRRLPLRSRSYVALAYRGTTLALHSTQAAGIVVESTLVETR